MKITLVEVTISPSSAPHNPVVETASFSYAHTNKTNNVKFAHQSLCNLPIASLIKATNAGFLKGAPHLDAHSVQKYLFDLDAHSVQKYLFASLATSKGHMKQPRKGIQSTCTTKPMTATQVYPLLPRPQQVEDHTMPGLSHPQHNNKVGNRTIGLPPYLIQELNDNSIANIICFGAFADKLSGVVYNNCTGNFPYMSLDGNICFFVMYHYKTHTILITPIACLDSECILEAYKSNFEFLVSKGFKPKVNVMDNQATKAI